LAGYAVSNAEITYSFVIDATAGPAFDPAELTVAFTATPAAP
jgi:hypothetical protein